MADVQKENGFTPIAHDILEALSRHVISPDEWRILMVIFRKTYGWDKKEDRISHTQFSDITGIPRNHVPRIINRLIERNLIFKSVPQPGDPVPQTGYTNTANYGFQKDYEKWATRPPNGGLSPDQGQTPSPKQGHTIDKKKQKKQSLTDEEFLNALKVKLPWVDLDKEMAKMDVWLLANPGRQKTRRFIVKWLDKVDKPMQVKRSGKW